MVRQGVKPRKRSRRLWLLAAPPPRCGENSLSTGRKHIGWSLAFCCALEKTPHPPSGHPLPAAAGRGGRILRFGIEIDAQGRQSPAYTRRPPPSLKTGGSTARYRCRRRVVSRLAVAVILSWLAAGGAQPALAQDEIRNFSKTPILVVETGGHHAPVRSLVWLDPLKLLSGGEDKVVKVWDFQDGGRLTQTIRPMIWRGARGAIYAMAVSPKPDAQGQTLVAVGGYGIEAAGGDLTIFRVPGLVRHPSGDVLKRLVRPQGNLQATAHTSTVTALAFNPAGTILASASNDQTVILWDVTRDFAPIRVLRAHTAPIRAMAFSPDGTRLVTAGADGLVVHWNVAQGQAVDSLPARVQMNTVAYSPDGRFIVVGSENGALIRMDAANFRGGNSARLRAADQRPVEIVAIHPDGSRLAVSIVSDTGRVPDPMTIACDLELRAMPNGNIVRQWPRVHGLVRAMAFSPDGKRLAYAGGPAQGILVQDTAALETSPAEL